MINYWSQQRRKITHSGSDQSSSTGQSNAPVRSWWNPRSILTLRARSGRSGWSGGVIQSMMGLFKLLVSSDLALDTPFWIYNTSRMGKVDIWTKTSEHTNSAILCTSPSSKLLSMILSWSPGIILNSAWNTLNSRRCLLPRSEHWEYD